MDRLIATNSVASGAADTAPLTGTPQFATDGNPADSIPATNFPAYQYNAIQEELMAIILAAGLTPDRTNNAQVLAALRTIARVRLLANTTYYVATTGNDTTGNGTSGSPWATLQHAANYIQQNIDSGGFAINVAVAAGSYAAGATVSGSLVGGGTLTFTGDPVTPSNVVIASSGNNFEAVNGAAFTVNGFELTNSGSSGSCLNAAYGGVINFENINFGTSTGAAHVVAGEFGAVLAIGNYTISGNATTHGSVTAGGVLDISGKTISLSGTPAFSNSFVAAVYGGSLYAPGITFSGSATGIRYNAILNGVIQTSGGGANYFPGSTAGSTSLGGQYA